MTFPFLLDGYSGYESTVYYYSQDDVSSSSMLTPFAQEFVPNSQLMYYPSMSTEETVTEESNSDGTSILDSILRENGMVLLSGTEEGVPYDEAVVADDVLLASSNTIVEQSTTN